HDYSRLSKVYSIWLVMEPQKGMSNTITRYRMVGSYDDGFESTVGVRPCDYAEIIMVHLGKLGDKYHTTLGLLNTVFSNSIGKEERIRRLEEDYKIVIDTSVFDEVEELMVNLDEDYKRYMTRLGREEGLAEGEAKERAVTVSILADKIIKDMEQESLSFDASFDRTGFPEEYRKEVKAAVEANSD
ncbi:MAG: hypothetical protein IJ592_01180, partial [Candidatus Methanomethylophilaceae archaeon]|nr:hypothetical protein [Candidatus Methanomethylophilaceae archaeon]